MGKVGGQLKFMNLNKSMQLFTAKYMAVKKQIMNIVSNLENIPHKSVPTRPNTYRVNCPFCRDLGHKEKHDFKLYINIEQDTIRYNCFRCGTHGAIEINTKDIVPILPKTKEYKSANRYSTATLGKPLSTQAFNYLQSRNISSLLIDKYNIREGRAVTDYSGYILIPIYQFGQEVYFTTRLYTGDLSKLKSILPGVSHTIRGKSTSLFNFDIAKQYSEVIITEGAFDSIRYPNAVALLGKIISINQLFLLENFFTKTKDVILCLDSQEKDDEINIAIQKNINLLQRYSSKHIWVCNLPYGDPAEYDVESFYNNILPRYIQKIK